MQVIGIEGPSLVPIRRDVSVSTSPRRPSIDYLERILNARVYDVAIETPLDPAPSLSARLNHTVFFKREDLQPVFSFKIRGAYNKMNRLRSEGRLGLGVVCASAGNHAQGVALAAAKMCARATIVMPTTTPAIKIAAVRARGGEFVNIVLYGESFDEANAHARQLEVESGAAFVHPYDDEDVIAGQGTVGMEILRQHAGEIDAVFCCVGGGGLLAGVAAYIKRLRPSTLVFGVEATDSDAMAQSLAAGERVTLKNVGLFADGAAVKTVGAECFRLVAKHADGVLRVDNDAICAAIKDVFEDTRSILEPAGALAVAGAKAWLASLPSDGPKRTVIAVASGANMNFDRLRFVAERAAVGEAKEAIFAATITEQPGAFKSFLGALKMNNGTNGPTMVTEFNYRYASPEQAHIFVGVSVSSRTEGASLIASLVAKGIPAIDLTDDELAKLHVRYMVGGRAPSGLTNERLFRFIFPERPGALAHFLEALSSSWNISLFHYRNHGQDFGRVLVGLQVPPCDDESFNKFRNSLGYAHVEETENPAFKLFLG